MPTFNELIQPDRKQINWLNSNFSTGHIFVDNTFQRRTVWVLKNKIRLIETVLKGFPMPEIYLWATSSDPATGMTRFSVVDGQQRLTAIRDFIAGSFTLEEDVLDDEPTKAQYRNKNFEQLNDKYKQAIWDYYVTTRVVPASIKKDEIVEIFLRLNETDKSLNPQELRNAEFNGLFIKNVETVADLPFWAKYKIFNAAAIRRMGDLQFISSLMMFLRSGIETEVSQTSINNMYDTYNDKYPQASKDFKAAKKVLEVVDNIFDASADVAKFFKSQVHLYPLFIVIYQQQQIGKAIKEDAWIAKMEKFVSDYHQGRGQIVAKYRAAATEGTQKRSNREERVARLKEYILGK